MLGVSISNLCGYWLKMQHTPIVHRSSTTVAPNESAMELLLYMRLGGLLLWQNYFLSLQHSKPKYHVHFPFRVWFAIAHIGFLAQGHTRMSSPTQTLNFLSLIGIPGGVEFDLWMAGNRARLLTDCQIEFRFRTYVFLTPYSPIPVPPIAALGHCVPEFIH